MRLKSLLQRCSISCDVMQNISPRSDLHARALVVIQSCRFVHINSLLQMHETDTRKTRPDQPFFSHASVAMHRCTVASFYDKWLELYFGVVLFLIFFSFLCNQALKLCNDKHIFGVGKFFFSNIFGSLHTRACSSSIAATPFLFPFIFPTTPRGRANPVRLLIHALDKISSCIWFGIVPIRFYLFKKKKKSQMTSWRAYSRRSVKSHHFTP